MNAKRYSDQVSYSDHGPALQWVLMKLFAGRSCEVTTDKLGSWTLSSSSFKLKFPLINSLAQAGLLSSRTTTLFHGSSSSSSSYVVDLSLALPAFPFCKLFDATLATDEAASFVLLFPASTSPLGSWRMSQRCGLAVSLLSVVAVSADGGRWCGDLMLMLSMSTSSVTELAFGGNLCFFE